jgi:hypothetical protein
LVKSSLVFTFPLDEITNALKSFESAVAAGASVLGYVAGIVIKKDSS